MKCWHMSGAGNDFAVVDIRGQQADLSAMAVALCKRTGADGFMALDHSDVGDFRLHFYNADGSRGEMCGNGSRCICRFAYDHGIAGDVMQVQTDAGMVTGWRLAEDQYRVRLNNPSILELDRLPGVAYVELGDPGIPHCVERIEGLSWENGQQLLERALQLRHHSAFPKGVNVNFYDVLPNGAVRLLTYERGVEDYTLACGTGSGSVSAVLWQAGELPRNPLTVENRGGTLQIRIVQDGKKITELFLEGPATILDVFEI